MGRMLEALRQGEGQRGNPVAAAILPEAPLHTQAQDEKPEDESVQEEFPFIEVGGGPGKKMEASAIVMATAMPQVRVEKKVPALPQPKSSSPLVPTLSQPQAMTVAFEPWPNLAKPRLATEIISYHQPEHPVSKQYDSLFEKVSEDSRVLLFAGAKGAGTTTVLLNLAFSGCMRFRKRLAIVESNLCRPVLAERLGIPSSPGWAELLAGSVALEKALQPTVHSHLYVLTGKERDEGIPSEALAWVLGWMRERFDLVLVDGPDLENGQKLSAFSGSCDGLYLVLPQNTSAESTPIQNAARLGISLRGLIHTQFENV
jgi:Mrp family chromosome partitioning ATPase